MIERKVCDLLNYVYHLGLMHFILMGCKKKNDDDENADEEESTQISHSRPQTFILFILPQIRLNQSKCE